MLGLGDDSKYHHEEIGEYAAEKGVDLLVTTGVSAKYMADKAMEKMGSDRVIYYSNSKSLESDINKLAAPGDVILVKGSRMMAMENIVKKILQ
jgi:UDP-N-acetylmuramoyl-tripeptide--D-alanyl-D-alanine ligase